MSGVEFQIKNPDAHRDLDGKTLHFCCETCAEYFTIHRADVIARRHYATATAPAR